MKVKVLVLAAASLTGILGTIGGVSQYREARKVDLAQETAYNLGRLEEAYRLKWGGYTPDVFALARMTGDWKTFIEALDSVVEVKSIRIEADRFFCRIVVRARDRARTPVAWESPLEVQNPLRVRRAGLEPLGTVRPRDLARNRADALRAANGGRYTPMQVWSLLDVFARVEKYNEGLRPSRRLVVDLSPANLYWDARLNAFRLVDAAAPRRPDGSLDRRWTGEGARARFEAAYGVALPAPRR